MKKILVKERDGRKEDANSSPCPYSPNHVGVFVGSVTKKILA